MGDGAVGVRLNVGCRLTEGRRSPVLELILIRAAPEALSANLLSLGEALEDLGAFGRWP
jgi:hypothetical protein